MDGKIEQRVYIKFCVTLGKSATDTPEMLHEAFGDQVLSRTAVSKPVKRQLEIMNIQGE
jgi:hypothetical protein